MIDVGGVIVAAVWVTAGYLFGRIHERAEWKAASMRLFHTAVERSRAELDQERAERHG